MPKMLQKKKKGPSWHIRGIFTKKDIAIIVRYFRCAVKKCEQYEATLTSFGCILAALSSFAVVPATLMGEGEVGSKYVSRNLADLLHKQLY